MGFMDMTFCASKGCKNKCGRQMTTELFEKGIKWWGNENFPYSVVKYCDDNGELIKYKNEIQ